MDERGAVIFCGAEDAGWIHDGLVGRSFVVGKGISLCGGCNRFLLEKGRAVAL